MSPHLVTAPADETYGSPESRLVRCGPEHGDRPFRTAGERFARWASSGRTPNPSPVLGPQVAHPASAAQGPPTLLGWQRSNGRRPPSERARSNLAATPAVRRPYGRIAAFLVTALLMLASFFTISSILASADLPPLEAWLLPLAFGPVFVLATKMAVSAWLSSAPSDRLPSPTQRVTSRIIGPCLACASLSLVSGVAVKSVAVGALLPLPDGISQLSSVLMFAGLALGELAGAAALAARQHRPGARAYAAAQDQYRWAVIVHEFAHARLRSPRVAPTRLRRHSLCIRSVRRDVPGLRWPPGGRGPFDTAGTVIRYSAK